MGYKTKRECGECTACCEGWLSGSAYGKEFFKGCPCYFKTGCGCSIYENRPENPCKEYSCEWLVNDDFPEWFKPNLSKVIISKKFIEEKKCEYLSVIEMGEKIDSTILNWLFRYYMKKNINMIIEVNGALHDFPSISFKNETKNIDYQ